MKTFINDDFLLQTGAARELYRNFARPEPIYDYHCHVPPGQIAANHQFADITEIWLGGDHYKWRAMRANGIDERFCTGDATPREKFDAWVATVPHALSNPLYHWSHLELLRYFGIDALISPATAESIWTEANARLPSLRVHDILAANRVAVVCTTDDPADSLDAHERIRRSALVTRVYPTFRPDKALGVASPAAFDPWVERLAGAARTPVRTFDDFLGALKTRHDDFHAFGGRLSDHGMDGALAEPCSHAEAAEIFKAARRGRAAAPAEAAKFGSFLMLEFGRWDARRGWTKQLHLGALRCANTRLLGRCGPDTGFDSIGDFPQVRSLGRYLDALDATGELPRMVLYNLNQIGRASCRERV
jgi:glucuronate isomerase